MTDRSLRTLLTEVIGSGPKTADDMTYDQARSAMASVLDPETDPTTLGAFLLAARWKVNTPTELAGFVDELRGHATITAPDVRAVDCGANYDGKTQTAILGVAAGLVAAAAGVPIVVHAGRRLPASQGDTYRNVLDALGIETDLTPQESARMVEDTGFGYYDQQHFLPALDALRDVRESMGVRTPINTVETVINPANASVHLGSFFHLSYGERFARTVVKSRSLQIDRVVLLQGLEGYDDIRPGQTTMAESRSNEAVEERRIDANKFGFEFTREDLDVPKVATDSATLTQCVLSGDCSGPIVDAVVLNAAIRIYANGAVSSVAEGAEIAKERIDSGAGMNRLDSLREGWSAA